jgi:hypothetical protein
MFLRISGSFPKKTLVVTDNKITSVVTDSFVGSSSKYLEYTQLIILDENTRICHNFVSFRLLCKKTVSSDKINAVSNKMMEFNDYRRVLLKEHHEKSLQMLEEEQRWKREKHLLEMDILNLQKHILLSQLGNYQQMYPHDANASLNPNINYLSRQQ